MRIEAPHFIAGLIMDGDKVIGGAPIVKYMIGWTRQKVEIYCAKKGWKAYD